MVEIATIARPYAQALYRIAGTKDTADTWSKFIFELAEISCHQDVQTLDKHPKFNVYKMTELILALIKSPMDEDAKQFVRLLVENRRLALMPEIANQFEALRDTEQRISKAEISSAFPLEEAQLKDLLDILEKKFGKILKPQITLDPNLIGGIRVKVGDTVLDTSVRARLAHMQAVLAS